MNFKKHLLRNFLIFLASVLLVLGTRMLSRTEAAAPFDNNKYLRLYEEGDDFDTECEEGGSGSDGDAGAVFEKYHETINCLFNKRIAVLVKEEKSEEKAKMDLSTRHLAVLASNEYFELRRAMLRIRRDEAEKAAVELQKQSDITDAARNLGDSEKALKRIDEELKIAEKALDQGLAAYSELQMALPLHQKYQEVVKSLEKYRDQLADIRREVGLYPASFIDVSTTACT